MRNSETFGIFNHESVGDRVGELSKMNSVSLYDSSELTDLSTLGDSDTSPICNNDITNRKTTAQTPDVGFVNGDKKANATVFVLFLINILNYMDRFIIAGVLVEIQNYYSIANSTAGLIQTVFVVVYMLTSLVFGYLGDRCNRKNIMCVGLVCWSVLTLISSFIGKNEFWWFLAIRATVGIGEASYSTVAPTIIADLFKDDKRKVMNGIFYSAIPIGSGLGFVAGSGIAKVVGAWQWAFRVTPVLGLVLLVLMCVVLKEPQRGLAEGGSKEEQITSYKEDIKELCSIKSYVFSTLGFTCVAFVTGGLSFWTPFFMYKSSLAQGQDADKESIASIFGTIIIFGGLFGSFFGCGASVVYKKFNPRADPLVCAFGLLTSIPFLFSSILFSKSNILVSWILMFFGVFFLSLDWSIIGIILFDVVIPRRRSTAGAFQILVSHALGDALSPFLIGKVVDRMASAYPTDERVSPRVESVTFQYAFYITLFVCVIGIGFFLATALFIENDKQTQENKTQGKDNTNTEAGIDNPITTSEEEEEDIINAATMPRYRAFENTSESSY